MLTDDTLQKALGWATSLHPAREVAIRVLIDGCLKVSYYEGLQARRPGAKQPSKFIFSEENLLQRAVYEVSEEWETDQELARLKKAPAYSPTADDMQVRYVKTLALYAMRLRCLRHAAVAVGSLLHTFRPHDISSLSEDFFSNDNIRRDKSDMCKQLKKRFPHLRTDADGQVALAAPGDREKTLIRGALSALAPWRPCPPVTTQSPDAPFIMTYFGHDSEKTDLERLHVLFDPACCGLARLVHEHNSDCLERGAKVLNDPENMLGAPRFGGFHEPEDDGGGGPPDWRARFNPTPLSDAEMSSVRHAVELNQRRRNQHRGGELRIYVDGVETEDFTSDYMFVSPDVARTASCIEVFGEDEGREEVLLAVFPLDLLEPDEEGLGQSLCVTLSGGRTIELSVAPVRRPGGEPSESVVRLKYTKSPEQPDGARTAHAPRPVAAEPRTGGDYGVEHGARGPHHDFWVRVFEGLYPRLKSYALAVAHGRVYDAEDLVQETCCRALRYTKDPEGITNPFAYLWRVMRNVWVDKAIRESAAGVKSLDELLDSGGRLPSVEPVAQRVLENEELQKELAARRGRLKHRERLLLGLYLEGYSCKDIADLLNEDVRITRSNLNAVQAKVRYRLTAAKKK